MISMMKHAAPFALVLFALMVWWRVERANAQPSEANQTSASGWLFSGWRRHVITPTARGGWQIETDDRGGFSDLNDSPPASCFCSDLTAPHRLDMVGSRPDPGAKCNHDGKPPGPEWPGQQWQHCLVEIRHDLPKGVSPVAACWCSEIDPIVKCTGGAAPGEPWHSCRVELPRKP
jgi:hypothetical protein